MILSFQDESCFNKYKNWATSFQILQFSLTSGAMNEIVKQDLCTVLEGTRVKEKINYMYREYKSTQVQKCSLNRN